MGQAAPLAGWWTVATLIAALALFATPARGDPPVPSVSARPAMQHGFDGFCARWMQKLRVREADNARSPRIRQNGTGYVGEFTGYGRKPLECRARATGRPSSPWIGQIVYEEFVYRTWGASPKAARRSKPEVAARTQVLEIFKFDGAKWVY